MVIVCLMPWQTTVPLSFNCAICGRVFSTNTATQKTCSAACARARKTEKENRRRTFMRRQEKLGPPIKPVTKRALARKRLVRGDPK